jgi:hypothetical protein
MRFVVIVPEAVQESMHGEQSQLRRGVVVLFESALDRDGDIAHPLWLVTREGEDVRRLLFAAEASVQRSQFRVVGETDVQARARGDAKGIATRPKQRAEVRRADRPTLRRVQRRVADEDDPQRAVIRT